MALRNEFGIGYQTVKLIVLAFCSMVLPRFRGRFRTWVSPRGVYDSVGSPSTRALCSRTRGSRYSASTITHGGELGVARACLWSACTIFGIRSVIGFAPLA